MSGPPTRSTAPECSARKGLAFYRLRHSYWSELRGFHVKVKIRQPRGCAHTLWTAHLWKRKAFQARQAYSRWLDNRFVLHDFEFGRGQQAWTQAVDEVQRVFPGTASWLLSCSGAEGGHGRWVGYGGQSYSKALKESDTVGGPMQFRWSTFTGMYRHALDHVLSRGYRVPEHLRDHRKDIAWRSALGQALAAGWARYTGNDNSHWSASWGNGC